jgi:uncharacterized protein YhbP (UPF0306 family)
MSEMNTSQTPNPTSHSLVKSVPSVVNLSATHSTLTLATTTASGLPQAAPLFFAAAADGSLIFVSGAESRHSVNIAANGKAAVTIYGDTWNWNEITGVQMEGLVSAIPAGPEREAAWETYKAKFPFVVDFEDEVSRSNFYRFTPRWVRLIDNRVRFGYREEFTVDAE